ncbi:hypothetical protein JKP88DRAFT_316975 [Tribonema minus]|uniref:Uncharacterized protein n=1 Tax=Tribonema minus TaxID=303371 RepID=A0A835YXM7_9STRA|nr:hypothetical protein JKP88DRAFT_316975 [Tribonema minus]
MTALRDFLISYMLFIATPAVMRLLLSPDFSERFWRMRNEYKPNMLAANPLALDRNYTFELGNGFEMVLREWLIWNQVPIAELPHVGPLSFVWGTLRPEHIGNYCNGTWMRTARWTDAHCMIKHSLGSRVPGTVQYNITEVVTEVPEAVQYCNDWQQGAYPPLP